MKYLSVCAGIEAATVAWHPLGWEAVGFSEIEKFPSAVLAHHYPEVPNYGDMTNHEQWPTTDIDVLVGGTPCQSFSVAGLRKGMADPRGNLALVYLAIAEQYRPRWLVWENVPGVLSSEGGRDFGAIVGGMVELGYSPCWRVLDAQYFGVAQRRRRVFIVASSRGWQDSAKVLLEPESLRRNPPPRREPRQNPTYDVAPSLRASGCGTARAGEVNGQDCVIPDVSVCMTHHGAQSFDPELEQLLPTTAPTLNATDALKWGSNQWVDEGKAMVVPNVTPTVAFGWQNSPSQGLSDSEEVSPTLDKSKTPAVAAPLTAVAFAQNQRDEKQQTYVAFTASDQSNKAAWESEVNPTLNAQVPNDTSNIQYGVRQGMVVRRLTPTECERLQGFPDGYTDIPGASDSARYKALGNSMAVPVMRWIGERINQLHNDDR